MNVAVTLHNWVLLKQKGDLEQAQEHLREAMRMKRSVYDGADHANVAVTLHELGMLLKKKGDLEQAEEHLTKALRMIRFVYDGADRENVAVTLHTLGMVLRQKGDLEQAEQHLKEALRMMKSVYDGADHENVAAGKRASIYRIPSQRRTFCFFVQEGTGPGRKLRVIKGEDLSHCSPWGLGL